MVLSSKRNKYIFQVLVFSRKAVPHSLLINICISDAFNILYDFLTYSMMMFYNTTLVMIIRSCGCMPMCGKRAKNWSGKICQNFNCMHLQNMSAETSDIWNEQVQTMDSIKETYLLNSQFG